MHKQRLFIIISAGLGMLATFLPWATVPVLGSISGTVGDGWLSFIIYLVPLILVVIGDKKVLVEGGKFIASVVLGAIGALYGIIKIFQFKSELAKYGKISKVVGLGVGMYIVIIAGIGLVAAAIIYKKKAVTE